MSSKFFNTSPYLRTSRNFPLEAQPLAVEVNKMYVDVANAVNMRIISTFPSMISAVTGESWFITQDSRQQSQRQVYTFTAAGNIPHGLILANIPSFTRIWGTFTDGSIWYPLPYVDATAANNQVSVTVGATNIVITAGGGSPPSITQGLVVLEWLSNP